MAKSIHNILADRTVDVENEGDSFTVELPTVFPRELTAEAMEGIYQDNRDIALAFMALGVQKGLIDVRAVARAEAKKENDPEKSEEADVDGRVAAWVPKIASKPGAASFDKLKKSVTGLSAEAKEELLRLLAGR